MSSVRKSRSESFLTSFPERWPVYARLAGLAIGFVEMAVGIVNGPAAVSTEVLAFAGGLVVAPNIVGVQSKRNEKRGES